MRFCLYLLLGLLFCSCQQSEVPMVEPTKSTLATERRIPSRVGLIHEMQGRWKDHQIKGAEVLISGNKFISIYKEEIRAQATFEAFWERPDSCPQELLAKKAKGFFIVYREAGAECYVLNRLEQDILEYTLLE